jgi:hypothetical protein
VLIPVRKDVLYDVEKKFVDGITASTGKTQLSTLISQGWVL